MGSATSPEYNRKKINQSRSNFFQSLLPTSRLKANVPSNSSSGDGIISGSPFPSSDGSSQNTSGSLYLSSPRNKHSGDMSESRLLTESADALCEAGQVNATSQSKNRTHVSSTTFCVTLLGSVNSGHYDSRSCKLITLLLIVKTLEVCAMLEVNCGRFSSIQIHDPSWSKD